ncbi:MAG: DUF3160 domain-containing protein [Halobacteriota archaeon]
MSDMESGLKKVRNKARMLLILMSLFTVCIAVPVVAQPTTPFMAYGGVNDSTGLPVNNPNVTITNLNTGEVFNVETSANFSYYQVSTSSSHLNTTDILLFRVRDNDAVTGFNRSVTQDAMNRGSLLVNLTLKTVERSQFFDTGRSANPYPSISGIHNGTITPDVTIRNVSMLYTYPCPGTGGHTESVSFYHSTNGSLITEGHWNGYNGDWHNISFPGFTLYAGHTYIYSIRTGSYPQIIHNHTLANDYGTITCTGFIDANGRSYNDRIPAICLEGEFVPPGEGYGNPKAAFSSHYSPVNITVEPCVPPYDLPITNIVKIANHKKIMFEFGDIAIENTQFRENGFVIRSYGNGTEDNIVVPYEDMKARGIPIFITADTLLHLYQIQLSAILKDIEEREFVDEVVDMSNAMLEQSKRDYETFDDPALKEAARRNVAYFSVALTLLQTPTEGYNGGENLTGINFTVPDYVKEEVAKEIENIEKHEGFAPGAVFNTDPNCNCSSSCCYCEDYSQYVPVGHYTQSEKLKRYFKAMMWYGRLAFLLKGCNGDDALIRGEDANISTIQAALISSELPEVKAGVNTTQDIWKRIYAVTAFFVGKADESTPYEYSNALNNVFEAGFNASELSAAANLLTLKAELAKVRSPEIYGGSGEGMTRTKGMRFMGQRFVPDSYMFQHLVSPVVGDYVGNGTPTPFTHCIITQAEAGGGTRCFPRGLDVMAVLESKRAEAILNAEGDTEYAGENTSYDTQLKKLKSEFAGINSTEWNQNLYWGWLYTLKPLLTEFGDGYPTFMRTEAWQKKELQTSLASWTELRHDPILYAPQNYTPPAPQPNSYTTGYVEPVPEFYARLLGLTQMTEKGLEDLDALNETDKTRLQSLECILERLITISVDELENKRLTKDEYMFINNFGTDLNATIAGVNTSDKETTVVADVYTDGNTNMVLEEGVGYVKLILVAYMVPDGGLIVGAGPVFSYYEFKQPMEDRLTDEQWKEKLRSAPPSEPEWVNGLIYG